MSFKSDAPGVTSPGTSKTKPKSPRPYVTGNRFAPICLRTNKCNCCASGFEHSRFVQTLGRISVGGERWRKPIMWIALISSCLTMILAILSCLGFEKNENLVRAFPWTKGKFHITSQSPPLNVEVNFHVGLGAIIVDTLNVPVWLNSAKATKLKQMNEVQTFDSQACKEGFLSETFNTTLCTTCQEASAGLLVPAIFAVITCLPSIQTDIQRMFPRYDLNCQKFMAVFVAGMFGTISTLATIYGYSSGCWRNFPEKGWHQITPENTLRNHINVMFDGNWYGGPGLSLMIAATLLKVVNMICHLIVPTPNFCRTLEGENDLIVIVHKKESEKDIECEKSSLKEEELSKEKLNNIDDEKLSLKDDTVQGCNTSVKEDIQLEEITSKSEIRNVEK